MLPSSYEYDARIEIQNHGRLYGKESPENFHSVSDYRDSFIAGAMKVFVCVNRFSRGVYRVQRELEEDGNGRASFDFSLITTFRLVGNVSQTYFDEGFGRETSRNYFLGYPRKIEDEILEAICISPRITKKDSAQKLNRTGDCLRYHLRQKVKASIIEHEGSTKAGKWIILELR